MPGTTKNTCRNVSALPGSWTPPATKRCAAARVIWRSTSWSRSTLCIPTNICGMSQNPTEWTQRMSPNVVGRGTVRLACTQIYPEESDPHTLGRGMAPALQIGRMDVPADIGSQIQRVLRYGPDAGQSADSRLPPRPPLSRCGGRPQVPDYVRVRARKGAGKPWRGRTSVARTPCTNTSVEPMATPPDRRECTVASNRPAPSDHTSHAYPISPSAHAYPLSFNLSLRAQRGNLVIIGNMVQATGSPRRWAPRDDKLGTHEPPSVIASVAWQSRRINGRRSGNEIAIAAC